MADTVIEASIFLIHWRSMTMPRGPNPWEVEVHGPYKFSFSPSRDDFSQVVAGRNWRLSKQHAMQGNEAAMIHRSGKDANPQDSWLFSCAFRFQAGKAYSTTIHARVDIPKEELESFLREDALRHRLVFRLGTGQTPGLHTQLLGSWDIGNPRIGEFNTTFSVKETGIYFFSLQAESDPAALGVIVVGENGPVLV